jgi:glutathione peroxidase
MSIRTRRAVVATLLGVALAATSALRAGERQRIPAPAAQTRGAFPMSLYEFKTETLLGEPADLAAYRGKVTLVVNVASYCGYTPQYKGLERLHRELQGKGFAVLGFPSNDFGEQEPGTAQEIADFCRLTYDVTFPMFAKVSTRPGPEQSPIYAFLGASGNLPAWNFSKYLVGRTGRVIAFFPSAVEPESPQLRQAIARALSAS